MDAMPGELCKLSPVALAEVENAERMMGMEDVFLIRNAQVYAPDELGKRDVLVCAGKIMRIAEHIGLPEGFCQVMDAQGKYLVPGFIDQHVHVTGGGGEGGFSTRTPEIQLSELIRGGITTVVGLLGTDGTTRSVENLYAKTMALSEEGITAYMMTGAYEYPGPTITGEADRDIMFCQNILGTKLALSDHRSSNITAKELIELGSKTRLAGMLSGKPGMVILHMGNGKKGLQPVFDALEQSDIPVGIFRPTHVGRNNQLREEAYKLLEMGGYIDFTCGSRKSGGPGKDIREAIKRGLATERITVSSDGQGSWSNYDSEGNLLEIGVSSVRALHKEFVHMVTKLDFSVEEALPYFTKNVAEALGLKGKKGVVAEGADADILLLEKNLALDTVIAKGSLLMQAGKLLKKGTYE